MRKDKINLKKAKNVVMAISTIFTMKMNSQNTGKHRKTETSQHLLII